MSSQILLDRLESLSGCPQQARHIDFRRHGVDGLGALLLFVKACKAVKIVFISSNHWQSVSALGSVLFSVLSGLPFVGIGHF